MNHQSGEEILSSLCLAAKFIGELFPLDCMVSVTDREKFIAYYPGEKIDIGISVNEPIPTDEIILDVIKTGQQVVAEVPKEVYGYAFKGIVIPVRDNEGRVIGTINTGIDLSTQNELLAIGESLAASFQEIAGSTQELAATAQHLNHLQNNLASTANELQDHMKNTGAMLELIDDVAIQTKMLGLNAAIEAARAGEAGSGFHVVAQEIRKLSDSTANSVQEISEILNRVNILVTDVAQAIENIGEYGTGQAAASEEITASVEENAAVAQQLVTISRLL